jgi:hypothetical protein
MYVWLTFNTKSYLKTNPSVLKKMEVIKFNRTMNNIM